MRRRTNEVLETEISEDFLFCVWRVIPGHTQAFTSLCTQELLLVGSVEHMGFLGSKSGQLHAKQAAVVLLLRPQR